MTGKKKPRTGGTGLLRIPCMVMMEVGGNFPSPQFYDRAVNIERQPARAAYHTHRGATTGGLSPPAEAPRFAPDYDAIMSGLGSWRPQQGTGPAHNKSPGRGKLDRGWHLP
jgi:hypothetical protein